MFDCVELILTLKFSVVAEVHIIMMALESP